MKAYESYKNVDLPWLKRVPEHWEVNKINRLFNLISSGTTPNSGKINFYENGNIPWLNSGDLYGDKPLIEKTAKHVTQSALNSFSTLKLYSANSIAIAMYGASVGNISIVPFEFCCNQACCVFSKPIKNLNLKYVYYSVIAGKKDLIEQARGGGQPNINQDILKQFRLPFPPFHEQEQIVRYLDWQNSRLNKLINAKKKEISLLEEQKQVLISQAVTKGLDPNAPLKDSGIDWIGQIPEHWSHSTLGKLTDITLGKMLTPRKKSAQDSLQEYLCARDIHFDNINTENLKQMYFSPSELRQYRVKNGDLLIVEGGAGAGGAAIIENINDRKIMVQNSVHILRSHSKLLNKYVYFWIYSLVKRDYINFCASVATIPHYTKDKVKSTPIPVPSIKEQRNIVTYLEKTTSVIDETTVNINKAISLLQEYRTRLVADVVTGQIDVRNIAIPNYETVTKTIDQPETAEDDSTISAEDQ